MLVKFEEEDKENSQIVPQNINIDEISIEAGKQEAELEKGKYTPTEEDLSRLEEELKRLNEQKFGALEEELVLKPVYDFSTTPTEEEPQIKRLSYTKRDGQY